MPELGDPDAMKLFLYHAAHGKQFTGEEDKRSIQRCIRKCYFSKGYGRGYHYHPLALEVLDLQLGFLEEEPLEWVNLSKVRNFSYFSGENPVFDILKSSFDLLPPTEQSLFMDVLLFSPWKFHDEWDDFRNLKEWLCIVYKEDGAHVC